MARELCSLYIYLTEHCNLRCTHCWQASPFGENEFTYLSFAECSPFLNEALELGLKNATLSGGEPLLSPDFEAFARYFYENKVTCSLETNGMLIDGVRLGLIERYRVCCAVSLDGRTPETHNRQRGRSDAYHRTLRGVRNLEARQLPYSLIMAISKANYEELPALLEWVKSELRYCRVVKVNIVNATGRANNMRDAGLLFGPQDLVHIAEEIGELAKTYPFVTLHVDPAFVSLRYLGRRCYCGGRCGYDCALSILANGSVSVCSLGKLVPMCIFGHVSSIHLRQVWESNTILDAVHTDAQAKLTGVCARCIFKKTCLGGCRAMALLAYGDLFAPHPTCQAYLESGQFPQSRLAG